MKDSPVVDSFDKKNSLPDLPLEQKAVSSAPTADTVQKIVSSLPVDHSGTSIYVKGWKHPACMGHPILIVHDLGEHTEMYRHVIDDMVERGKNVYMFDLRGHGRSGKRLGHAPSYDILIKDLLQVAAWVRHKESGLAPIIIGHGIGALITMDFTKSYPTLCKAMVLSAPFLELVHETIGLTRFFIKVLADVAPMVRIPIPLCPQFTRDLMSIQHQIDDEDAASMVYFPRLTAIFANELLTAIKRAELSFITYPGPVLILCPGKDDVCLYSAVKKAVAIHVENNINVIDFADYGHALISDEVSRTDVIEKIVNWIDDSVTPSPLVETVPPAKQDHLHTKQLTAEPFLLNTKPGASRL